MSSYPGHNLPEQVVRAANELRSIENDRLQDDHIKAIVEITSSQYDKGAAYANLIISAGYAAFFGLWTLTTDFTPVFWRCLSGLFSCSWPGRSQKWWFSSARSTRFCRSSKMSER